MAEPSTPLMRQYSAIKQQHPNALLLFRLGDFYELFFEDAVTAARELQITLTSRNKEKGVAIPMCGVPYHAAQGYINRLIQKGYRVAICDQMEDPRLAKKLVKREVTRVVTPGTAVDAAQAAEHTYLAAVRCWADRIGLAYAELSTGEFRATEFDGPDRETACAEELAHLRPRELLWPGSEAVLPTLAAGGPSWGNGRLTRTEIEEWAFAPDYGRRLLCDQFGVLALDGFGLAGRDAAVSAAGAVLHYLKETQRVALTHLDGIHFYQRQQWMVLDSVTARNLELLEPLFAGETDATLIATVDRTRTSMGARLLKMWLLRPSLDRAEIEQRLDAVEELKRETIARGGLDRHLGSVLDLERLLGKVALGSATPRDLLGLGTSLERMPALRAALGNFGLRISDCGFHAGQADSSQSEIRDPKSEIPPATSRLAKLREQIDELRDVAEDIARAVSPQAPANAADGGVIRDGCDAELDTLRDLSRNSKSHIAQIEARERARTGVGSLKVRFNNIFGYYIEISKANQHLAPADYERKQTLVNAERFTTPELKDYERRVLDAEEKILELERRLFAELRARVAGEGARIRRTAAALAELDVLADFAALAAERRYARPEFADTGEMQVVGGRHPVIERLAERDRAERFVANDLYLNASTDLVVILTGPNMGGKSTYLRQTALIAILAQAGSFVPADSARLPIVDRIFTRIGASDNLARGRSTFMVEMTEAATILNTATPRSLVLLDEIGRGTATFDGLAIAWAVVEHIHGRTRAKTLFATHYHELTELADHLPGVKNYHVSVKETESGIVFLRKVEPGAADRSYGIEVARLAGLPATVVERSRQVLAMHERSEEQVTETLSPGARPAPVQLTIFTPLNQDIVRAIAEADLDRLRPIEALTLLAKLKQQIT
jgi:DNA mismatch repair protein MutS